MNDAPEGARGQADATAATTAEPAVLEARGIRKTFVSGDGSELTVLDRVEMDVAPGEAVAVVGASGAGKSTLLHILGGLDAPTEGRITIGGHALSALSERDQASVRNRKIGFVFQFHHLLREFSALENVMMPLLIGGTPERKARQRARQLLDDVGLAARLEHRPTQLSGGEQQRVAVARALVNRPLLLIADEPSGNLDTQTSERLHGLFFRLRDEHGVAMILATHNRELADQADRVLLLREGNLRNFYPA